MLFPLTPSWVVVALSLYVSTSLAYVPLSSINRNSSGRYVPHEYIVEMDSVSGLAGKRAYTGRTVHDEVYHHMRKRGILFDVNNEFDTPEILVGASVKIESADDITRVTEIPGVKAVRPVLSIPRPQIFGAYTVNDPKDPRLPPNPLSTHLMTGVDKLHAQGILGEGIKIGIIDTGIDYKHPALGGAMGPGHKVIGGYDFCGDAYTGKNTAVPDNDPLDTCAGHGTHVAGIIGADPGNPFGISGAAYKASIAAYRIFGCKGSTSDDLIVQSLIRGYNDGMDILTLSLGGVDGWTEGTGSVVASRIAEQGRVVTIAAGNDGAQGSWYTSSPGNGLSVMSIGSIDNVVIPVQNVTVIGVDHMPIPYLQALPFNVTGDLPVYATSNDTVVKNDACDPLPATTPDLSGYVVVVHRGTCPFTQKLANAAKKGAKTFLIYNSDDGEFAGIEVGNYTAALISAQDGKFLVNQFAAGVPIKLNFPAVGGAHNLDDPKGGLVSAFSSYGPTYDMFFKPAFSAPGGNILSTVPVSKGSYAVQSGTSMATPFAAGAAALILQAKGKSKDLSRSLRDLFQTTAVAVSSAKPEGSLFQTVSQQGAGLMQVDRALNTKTFISPGQLMLNDTAHFEAYHTITVKNTGSESVTYSVSHVAAGTAQSMQAGSIFASTGPVELTNASARVTIIPTSLTVSPGSERRVSVYFEPPQGVDESRLPVFSGFIKIESPAETLKVTYLGASGNLKKRVVLDNTDTFFGPGASLPLMLDFLGLQVQDDAQQVNYSMTGINIPSIVYRLAFGTPEVRIDLCDKNVNLKPTIVKRSWLSWLWGDDTTDVNTIGPLQETNYVPRNSAEPEQEKNGYNTFVFNGTFANKTRVENGEYRILLRALKVTGNSKNSSDYESWLSPIFGVNYTGPF
ncbi:hypothetical protein HGRIS_002771 [Hohenbuehelia grisea]|uniref:Subtilisin-like protease n=1 Tax=Hohenbuehelia grisea TaxID=104357 RepID=A0ABR3JMP2_9AGAR